MDISIKKEELTSLLKSFYELSQIRIVFFDRDFNELFGYPENHSKFCSKMRCNEAFDKKCVSSTADMCHRCKKENKLVTGNCHAGLTEVVAPLTKDNVLLGYIMFGQIRSVKSQSEFTRTVTEKCRDSGLSPEEIEELTRTVHYKTHKQIESAAEIINVFLSYINMKEIVDIKKDTFTYLIANYIENNLASNLSVREIADNFYISRTMLYEITKVFAPKGIAAYIQGKRIEKAKHLIRTTNKTIEQISADVGFNDSGYFRRVFKKYVGISANKYRIS